MSRDICPAQWEWGEAAPGWPASLCLDLHSFSKWLEPLVPATLFLIQGSVPLPTIPSALWLLETHQILWLAGHLLPLILLGGF